MEYIFLIALLGAMGTLGYGVGKQSEDHIYGNVLLSLFVRVILLVCLVMSYFDGLCWDLPPLVVTLLIGALIWDTWVLLGLEDYHT